MPRARVSDEVEIDYDVRGPADGRPLVLIRGLGTQRVLWPEELLAALEARGFRVITFDNRDVGLSTKLDAAGVADIASVMAQAAQGQEIEVPYTVLDMAADVVGVLDALGVETAHVAGISMGGMIVQALACRHPARLVSVASIMSSTRAPGLPQATPEAMQALMSQPASSSRDDVIAHGVKTQRVIGSPGFLVSDDYLREQAARAFDRCYHPEGVARQMVAVLGSPSLLDELGKVDVPTLVIHGADDPLVPLEAGRDTARRIPNAELIVVPGMGHDVVPDLVPTLVDALDAHARRAERRGA